MYLLPVTVLLAAGTAWSGGGEEDYDEFLDSLYRDTVPVIQPEELPGIADSKENLLVLDVRSEPERSVSFIDGSRFADFETFDIEPFLSLPRDTPIVAYCAVGWRSERVGEQLIAAGFTDVSHMYGGIIEWHNRGYLLAAGPEAPPAVPSGQSGPPVHGRAPRWGKYVEDGYVTYEPEAD
jgi:rhodanese-related sulfurtransferase